MSPLNTRPRLRRRIYAGFWAAGLALGSCVAVLGTDTGWLNSALAVYAYLGTAIGYTAGSNVGKHA